MRIFSYIFTALVTIFVINVALSFSLPAYREALVSVRTEIFPTQSPRVETEKDTAKIDETNRLVESLDRIDKHIESLTEAKKSLPLTGGMLSSSGATGSTLPTQETAPQELNIPISGIFLSKIMPDVMPKKVENA